MENLENNKKEHLIITEITDYRPDKILSNSEIEEDFINQAKEEIHEILDKNVQNENYEHYGTHLEELKRKGIEDPIFKKVGIKNRHSVDNNDTASGMAIKAGKKLLEKIKIDPNSKTLLTVGTLSAEDKWPTVAAKTQHHLELTLENGYENISAYDIGAACSGWTFAIDDAVAKMIAKGYMSAIIFSSDTMTRMVDLSDKSRMLFGDGATASYLEFEKPGSKGFRINATEIVTLAQIPDHVFYPTELALGLDDEKKRSRMNLNGEEVYKAGVEYSANFILKYLKQNNLSLDDFDYIIPHQANGSMLKSLAEKLQVTKNKYGEEKVLSNIENTGNTAASSIPLALFDFKQRGQFKNGDRILMCSFGAGYTLGIVDVEVVL